MLYHVEDRQRGLLAIRRVLRRGGALFATTNGAGHLGEIKDLLRELAIDGANVSAAFTLENGEAQLRRVFPRVRRDAILAAITSRMQGGVFHVGKCTGALHRARGMTSPHGQGA